MGPGGAKAPAAAPDEGHEDELIRQKPTRSPALRELISLTNVLIFCRFVHFVSTMSLFGASIFLALLAPPRLAMSLDRSIRRIAVIALSAAAITLVIWLLLEGGEMGGGWVDAVDPDILFSVLSDTAFGHIWLARILLALALLALAAPEAPDAAPLSGDPVGAIPGEPWPRWSRCDARGYAWDSGTC